MSNDFFNASGAPAQGGQLVSPNMRAEFAAVAAGFDKLPTLTGNAYKIMYVNASGAAMDVVGGDGLLKLSTAGIPSIAVAGTDYLSPAAIGVTVQAHSANLDEYAAVNPTAAGLALLDDADAAAQRATLGSSVVGDAVFVAASQAAAQAALGISASGGSEESLTGFYHPAAGSAYQDMYRSGWLPSWFNQQWGGAQWGTLPDGSFGSVATGNVQDDSALVFGNLTAASVQTIAQRFNVSEDMTVDAVWIKLYKQGNPTDNVTARIWTISGSDVSVAQGSLASLSGKLITSKTDGEWYKFTGLACALTAGTTYGILLDRSSTHSDTANYTVKLTAARKYPVGDERYYASGAWNNHTNNCMCFLIQNPDANSIVQSGGMFDYKLSFKAGSPANQSRAVAQPLANFYDGQSCSVLYRGTFAVSSNVWDFCYGLDHDRITLTVNASGYPVLTIYESDRTVATVTGTGSVTSGNHDVGIRVRTMGDGADYATLYVDGASVGTPLTAQTFTMAPEMARLGTARLGDGFGLAPTWTQDMQMTSLPSAQGWTWTGTATEANAMSIQGGKLYQNANGYTSTQTGYYAKTVALNNATGTTVVAKLRAAASPNSASTTIGSTPIFVQLQDGSKDVKVCVEEYFLRIGSGVTTDFTLQGDFKSQDHVFVLCGKGADYYLFIDGKLAVDGTGKFASATANNNILFGDGSTTASDNADTIWSYVKYYQGGMLLPTAATATCSEFAHWSGDKSALFPSLYNSGTPVSVKQLCGVPRNYQFEQVVQREVRQGVTVSPTTGAGPVLIGEMEGYSIGASVQVDTKSLFYQPTSGARIGLGSYVDGTRIEYQRPDSYTATSVGVEVSLSAPVAVPLGLHKYEARMDTGSGTLTAAGTSRNIQVEARS